MENESIFHLNNHNETLGYKFLWALRSVTNLFHHISVNNHLKLENLLLFCISDVVLHYVYTHYTVMSLCFIFTFVYIVLKVSFNVQAGKALA